MTQRRPDGLEEVVRTIVGEAVRFAEEASRRDGTAPGGPGIDVDRARRWAEELGRRVAGEAAAGAGRSRPADTSPEAPPAAATPATRPAGAYVSDDAAADVRAAADGPPHPRDLPTEAQGRALAAIDAGRWTLDEEGRRLRSAHDGPAPEHPKRTVRELRDRDWLRPEGGLTRAGMAALDRWLLDA